jgi:hypothetical protein
MAKREAHSAKRFPRVHLFDFFSAIHDFSKATGVPARLTKIQESMIIKSRGFNEKKISFFQPVLISIFILEPKLFVTIQPLRHQDTKI